MMAPVNKLGLPIIIIIDSFCEKMQQLGHPARSVYRDALTKFSQKVCDSSYFAKKNHVGIIRAASRRISFEGAKPSSVSSRFT